VGKLAASARNLRNARATIITFKHGNAILLRDAFQVVNTIRARHSFRHHFNLACSDMIPRAIKRLFHQASIRRSILPVHVQAGSRRRGRRRSIGEDERGLNVRTDDIITIAAIKIRGNRILTQ